MSKTEENAQSASLIKTQNNVHDISSETAAQGELSRVFLGERERESSERVLADAAALDQELVQAETYATTRETDAVPVKSFTCSYSEWSTSHTVER